MIIITEKNMYRTKSNFIKFELKKKIRKQVQSNFNITVPVYIFLDIFPRKLRILLLYNTQWKFHQLDLAIPHCKKLMNSSFAYRYSHFHFTIKSLLNWGRIFIRLVNSEYKELPYCNLWQKGLKHKTHWIFVVVELPGIRGCEGMPMSDMDTVYLAELSG